MENWDLVSPLSISLVILFLLTLVYGIKPYLVALWGEDYEEIVFLLLDLRKGDELTLYSGTRLGYQIKHPDCLKVRIDNVDVFWDDEKRGELIALVGTTRPERSVITAVSSAEVKVWSLGRCFDAHRKNGFRYLLKQATVSAIDLVGIIAVLVVLGFLFLGWLVFR